jgi:dephospho-CoA kinase
VSQDPPPVTSYPFVVALTGGIASGKTLISDEFSRLGVPVVDTDVIAHAIVEPGQSALMEIAETFGAKFIDQSGKLKRSELRSLVFSDPNARKQLESILHPRIRQKADLAIRKVTSDYCILVIPLLVESGAYPNVNHILVVDVEPDIQVKRLMARDDCTQKQAKQVLAAQANREQRLGIADDILDNSGSTADARLKVAQLHLQFLQLAKNW